MKAIFILVLTVMLLLFASTPTFAQDAGVDSGASRKQDRDRSIQQRDQREQREASEAVISLDAIFLPLLAERERRSEDVFGRCRIVSRPLLAADLGASWTRPGGWVDPIAQSYYQGQAASAGAVLHESRVRRYRDCLSLYGAIVGQAMRHTVSALGPLARPQADGSIKVAAGTGDLREVGRVALDRAVREGPRDPAILAIHRQVTGDRAKCRWAGSLDKIQCGSSAIGLTSQPSLNLGAVGVYGQGFAGVSATIRLSGSTAQSRDLALSQRQGWERNTSSKAGVSLSRFLPAAH